MCDSSPQTEGRPKVCGENLDWSIALNWPTSEFFTLHLSDVEHTCSTEQEEGTWAFVLIRRWEAQPGEGREQEGLKYIFFQAVMHTESFSVFAKDVPSYQFCPYKNHALVWVLWPCVQVLSWFQRKSGSTMKKQEEQLSNEASLFSLFNSSSLYIPHLLSYVCVLIGTWQMNSFPCSKQFNSYLTHWEVFVLEKEK